MARQQPCNSHFLLYIRKRWLRLVVVLNLDKVNTCCRVVVLSCIMFPNPGNDKARIVQKRRTSSSCTALLLMGESPRVCNTSEGKSCTHLNNESVWAVGAGDDNVKKAMTTTIGTGKNNNIPDAASGKENHALEKDVVFSEEKCRDVYIAKRRVGRRARK
jgi:hypothetical protein